MKSKEASRQRSRLPQGVEYHHPCYLGPGIRANHIFGQMRKLIEAKRGNHRSPGPSLAASRFLGYFIECPRLEIIRDELQSMFCLALWLSMIGGPKQDTSILEGVRKQLEIIEPLYVLSESSGLRDILEIVFKRFSKHLRLATGNATMRLSTGLSRLAWDGVQE